MSPIHSLQKAIKDGVLLGPNTFAGFTNHSIDKLLDERDTPACEPPWVQLYERLKDIKLDAAETRDLTEMEKTAFLTTYHYCPHGDLSS